MTQIQKIIPKGTAPNHDSGQTAANKINQVIDLINQMGAVDIHDPAETVTFRDFKGRQIGTPDAPFTGAALNLSVAEAVAGAFVYVVYQGSAPLQFNGASYIDATSNEFVPNRPNLYIMQRMAYGLELKLVPPYGETLEIQVTDPIITIRPEWHGCHLRIESVADFDIQMPERGDMPHPDEFWAMIEDTGAGKHTYVSDPAVTIKGGATSTGLTVVKRIKDKELYLIVGGA